MNSLRRIITKSSSSFAAIALLKDREPGAFVIRDSHSFRGAYGLAMKVAFAPPTVQQSKKGSVSDFLLSRHPSLPNRTVS